MSQPKQGNYFKLPNEIFNMDLSAGEIALYAFLMRMEDRETYTCYPSYKTIGKALQMSKNTVMKYVRQLEEKELIETERTLVENREGALRNGNLMYKILPIKQAVDAFHRRQLYNYGSRTLQGEFSHRQSHDYFDTRLVFNDQFLLPESLLFSLSVIF